MFYEEPEFRGPIIWRYEGDKQAGRRYRRMGQYIMDMLERGMSFRGLDQMVMRRQVTPDVRIKCSCIYGIRTVTITVTPGAGGERQALLECFANTTVALAYVLDVAGVEPLTEEARAETEWLNEPVCQTCIGAEGFPRNYYCTKGVRYTVAVCDGKGEYVLFTLTKAASTDYTPRCPGEQVLVMQHRTPNLPEPVLKAADANPMNKISPFTCKLVSCADECLSILPYTVAMPRTYEAEG